MRWAYKDIDDTFTEHNGLPQTWKNISNFFALEKNLEYLRTLNWFPLIDDTSHIEDSTKEYYGPPTYSIDDNFIVRKKCQIFPYPNPLTSEQIQEQQRTEFFRDLRIQRDNRLRDSDWTQLLDIQKAMGSDWVSRWAVYRQELRDLPSLYEDDQIVNFDQIAWPVQPQG